SVDRLAEAIQDPAEHPRPHVDAERPTERFDGAAGVDALEPAERHEEDAALVEADDLGEDRRVLAQAAHPAQLAEGDVEPDGLDDEADDPRRPAVAGEARETVESCDRGLNHCSTPGRSVRAPGRSFRRRSARAP